MPCAQQGRVYETIGRQQWLAAGLLLSVPWVLGMTSIKCPTRLLKGTAGYMLCFLFIFNDFCQTNCLKIYRTNLRSVFGVGRWR